MNIHDYYELGKNWLHQRRPVGSRLRGLAVLLSSAREGGVPEENALPRSALAEREFPVADILFAIAADFCAPTGNVRAQASAATDRAVLESIHYATGGDDWTENDNWLSAVSLGSWYGVETNEQGRLIGLWLGGWVALGQIRHCYPLQVE